MSVEVNWLAVVLAAASSMVVGAVWYMPNVFGNAWMQMTKSKMGKDASAAKLASIYSSVFIASLITAYVLAHVSYIANKFFGNSFLSDSLSTGFWLWLGFTAFRMYVHDTFEGRRKKLFTINVLHEFVTIMVMALIIGLLKP